MYIFEENFCFYTKKRDRLATKNLPYQIPLKIMYTSRFSVKNSGAKHVCILLVSKILLACASANTDLIKGPVGSPSELFKLSKVYKVYDSTIPRFLYYYKKEGRIKFLEQLDHDVSSEMYPSIQNLNEYLEPFENCFVYMKNHKSIEIHPKIVPIVLAEMETQLWESSHTYKRYKIITTETNEYIMHIQKQSQSRTKTLKANDFNCTSDYQVKSSREHFYNGDCLVINHTKFVMNTRPWKCEVHFDIFASPYRTISHDWNEQEFNLNMKVTKFNLAVFRAPIDMWYYPDAAHAKQSIFKLSPSTMPVINFNIIMTQEYGKWINANVYSDWIHAHVDPY